ncbi:MAG: GTP cyclohydrolase I [Deltaproteobacteria bacterium]|nr:GTP cyclohydrolase I [Deltaproteobacteria bacterium]
MGIDRIAAERALGAFLEALGLPEEARAELGGTPARVVEAYATDLLSGYAVDVAALLAAETSSVTTTARPGVVVLRDAALATLCPHHLLPGLGHATIAYRPGARLVGIGTLARVLDAYSRRLTLQETIGERVARALVEHAGARSALCRIELSHSCLSARGARQPGATVVSVATAGDDDPALSTLAGGAA